MRRILWGGLGLSLFAVCVAVGFLFAVWTEFEPRYLRISLAETSLNLRILGHLRSHDVDGAMDLLNREIDARAIRLSELLAEKTRPAEDRSVLSCQLQRIQKHRAKYPATHADAAHATRVSRALAHSVDCPKRGNELAALPRGSCPESAETGDG